jgi:hypothetical protein
MALSVQGNSVREVALESQSQWVSVRWREGRQPRDGRSHVRTVMLLFQIASGFFGKIRGWAGRDRALRSQRRSRWSMVASRRVVRASVPPPTRFYHVCQGGARAAGGWRRSTRRGAAARVLKVNPTKRERRAGPLPDALMLFACGVLSMSCLA